MRTMLVVGACSLALTAAGCGGDDGGDDASDTKSMADRALDFSQCMRDEGIKDFPDPEVSGGRVMLRSMRDGVDLDSARVRTASEKCREKVGGLGGPGGEMDPEQRAAMQDAFREFAKCMRAEGINMPDPQFSRGGGGGGTVRLRAGAGNKPDDPKFKAADRKCQPKLREAEEKAGIER